MINMTNVRDGHPMETLTQMGLPVNHWIMMSKNSINQLVSIYVNYCFVVDNDHIDSIGSLPSHPCIVCIHLIILRLMNNVAL